MTFKCLVKCSSKNKDGVCRVFESTKEFVEAQMKGGACGASWMYSPMISAIKDMEAKLNHE